MKTIDFMKKLLARCLLPLLLGMFVSIPVVFGQNQIPVKGVILDSDGQPVIGAAIMQKVTSIGVTTDLDGNFSFVVPAGAVLEISSIGYATQEVTAAQNLNITLYEESTELDETIVVGYGTQKKASLTSAISNIRSEELNATKQSDALTALQGKVPGLLIRQRTGDAGDFNTDLKLRGYDEPLVIVDGLVRTAPRRSQDNNTSYSNSSSSVLAQLNPEDIESISVLKDASAAIYGMGAENGVILVTTKQGSIGAPTVKYSNRFSFGVPTALPEEVDILTWFHEANEMAANVGNAAPYSQDLINHYVNGDEGWGDYKWYSQFYKDYSFSQNHQVSLNSGNNQTQYYLSVSFNNDEGILNGPQLGYKSLNYQGANTVDFTVTPYCRIIDPVITYEGTKIVARFKVEVEDASKTPDVTVALFGFTDRWVSDGNNNFSGQSSAKKKNVKTIDGQTVIELTADTTVDSGTQFTYKREHFLRIGAVATGSGNSGKCYNFSPVYKMSSDFSKVEEVTDWEEQLM